MCSSILHRVGPLYNFRRLRRAGAGSLASGRFAGIMPPMVRASVGACRRSVSRRVVAGVLAGLAISLAACACRSQADELPKLGQVSGLDFVSQSGQSFSDQTVKGKVWAAAFMFTRCPTVCPRITRTMRELQLAAQGEKVQLHLVSFSVDPDNDTPAVLSAYARRFEAELGSWSFVTGDPDAMVRVAQEGFKLAVAGRADDKQEHYGITHGSHLVLVDPQMTIRGYYRSSEEAEMTRLLGDARALGP